MLDVVRDGLQWADQACLAISFTRCSGLQLLIDPLRELSGRKGRVQLLTSTYQSITQPEALSSLLKLKDVDCYVQDGRTGFHSKFWLFDDGAKRAECWAGSSNLSKGGLADNLEWNLRSTEPEVAQQTRRQFDALLQRSDVYPLSQRLIDAYSLRYSERAQDFQIPLAADGFPIAAPTANEPQREALSRLANMRSAGLKRAAIIAATGIGKTYLAAFDCQQMQAKSVLFVSHRLEHLAQAERTFARVLTNCRSKFVTVQSLRTQPSLLKERWDYLVIDEFHHVEADGYLPLRALRDNGHTFLLGLTATPERQDGRDILEWCDWNIAYEVRLPEAIERRWLLPFHYFGISDTTIEFARINWHKMTPALELQLSVPQRVDLILAEALQYGFDGPRRATVGFCAGINHAKYMAEAFKQRGQVALAVWGTHGIEEREELYARLADPSDPLEWLFVADLLNEGVDIPAINSLLFLRPTESASVFLQQLGRGLRLTPGCEVLTVLDFVGHHQRAWLALQAINNYTNTGAQVQVGDLVVKPPRSCEVVLQRKTLEMLEKIRRHTSKRDACSETYEAIKNELGGRAPLPIDLWKRDGAPPFSDFRSAYGDWLGCQEAHRDLPEWAEGLDEQHLVRRFLRSLETDWQAQRVHAYATIWGLANGATDLKSAYESFFERFPQWHPERAPFPGDSIARTFERKLAKGAVTGKGLARAIVNILGTHELLRQVEGRILALLNRAFEERHGGILRGPLDLRLHRFYRRPEIIRHFGVQYDPARHNSGFLQFQNDVVLIIKLDTSGAQRAHQYDNRFIDPSTFAWTSQNQMSHASAKGRVVVEHLARHVTVRLFVSAGSHAEACYLGPARYVSSKSDSPMHVRFVLEHPAPADVLSELGAEN